MLDNDDIIYTLTVYYNIKKEKPTLKDFKNVLYISEANLLLSSVERFYKTNWIDVNITSTWI